MYNRKCEVWSVQCAVCNVQLAIYSLQFDVISVMCVTCNLPCELLPTASVFLSKKGFTKEVRTSNWRFTLQKPPLYLNKKWMRLLVSDFFSSSFDCDFFKYLTLIKEQTLGRNSFFLSSLNYKKYIYITGPQKWTAGQRLSDDSVCRIAMATPGLLKSVMHQL